MEKKSNINNTKSENGKWLPTEQNKIKKTGMLVHDEKEDDGNYRNEMTFNKILRKQKIQ